MSDEDLFAQAMTGVRPLAADATPKKPIMTNATNVHALDIRLPKPSASPKHMSSPQEDGDWILRANGMGADALKRLALGKPAVSQNLDLHGMTRNQAIMTLEETCQTLIADKKRVLRVIHGRGLHSPEGRGIIKQAVYDYLRCGALSGYVLAAIPCPKSAGGACLILLRRDKQNF